MSIVRLPYGGSRAPGRDIDESPSSAVTAKDGTTMSRMSARKEANRLKDIAPDLAAWALWTAFPSRSANECSEQAASVLGGHPDTYRRILGKETQRICLRQMLPALAMACAKAGIDLFEMLGKPNVGSQERVDQAPVVRRAREDSGGEKASVGREGEDMAREKRARANEGNRAA